MTLLIEDIKAWFERQAFGVCDWWGEKLSIKSSNIRLFFIYASCLTVGSPVIIYMIMAFVLNLRNMTRRQRGSVWDL
ncbi:MAG TPA: PspC family transcriptional regulator [Bacteroidia bacterium]|nr:PspC family transcriptional regulator [Bacteroidia bacterium]